CNARAARARSPGASCPHRTLCRTAPPSALLPGFGTGPQRQLAFRRLATAGAHAIDFFAERVDVLEAAVHRRESHVRDLVEIVQLLHRQLADQPRVHFALAERAQFVADVHDRGIERFARHRALLQRLEHAIAELAFVERLAAGVVLDDARHHQLGRLERRETLVALQALAAAADLLSFAGQARVDDFR